MATAFDEVASLLVNGTSESLSRIGKNEASRSRRNQANAADNPHRNVAAKTISRRETQTKGGSRSSYLQSIEDAAGMNQNNGSNNNANTTNSQDYAAYLREDDGHRREMCSSPRLHPGLQLERLRDYQSDRGNQLGKLVNDDKEFSKIQLRDDGTSLPGSAPVEQAWTPRETKQIPIDDPLALQISARGQDDKREREERKKPGAYYTGKKPIKFDNPGVGHYRPKYDMIETRQTGGFISSPRTAAETPRGLLALQQQQQQREKEQQREREQQQMMRNNNAGSNISGEYSMDTSMRRDISPGAGGGGQAKRLSPTHTVTSSQYNNNENGSPRGGNQAGVKLDPKSHGDISKRPPFGVGSGFSSHHDHDGDASPSTPTGGDPNNNNTDGNQKKKKGLVSTSRQTVLNIQHDGPESGDYYPLPLATSKRTNYCFVNMGKDKQDIDRNPPAIPSVDIAYPAAEGIALSLKSRTPRAFIAPKKPSDAAAHASKIVGHYAESAWVANGTQRTNNGAGTNGLPPAEGDRLDIDPYKSKDSLVKHSASMVDFARSAKKSGTRSLNVIPTDTSNVDLYDGRPAPSTKRLVNPVNMDKMAGRPPVVQAPDVRAIEVNDELVHPRIREAAFAPLQPQSVQIRMQKLRSEREGVPRLCGGTDVSPLRPRVGAGAVDFSKNTPRNDPNNGNLDLVYENLDPAIASGRRRTGGNPFMSTTVSRNKREQLAKPKWGALDRIYDKERGEKLTQAQTGTLYSFEKRVDRDHAFSGAMPSETFLKRTTSGQPGPGQYNGEVIPALGSGRGGSPGRSFTKASKR